MDKDNQTQTIESYNEHIDEYISKDANDQDRTAWYWGGVTQFLEHLDPTTEILEIGSGTGTDAAKIESEGFSVARTDVAQGFVDHMRSLGVEANYLNILEGPSPKKYDAVYANAVFLHFTEEEFATALLNAKQSLTNGGLLCLGLKVGDYEGWRDKGLTGTRYFKYWQVEQLEQTLEDNGFEVLHSVLSEDGSYVVCTTRIS